MSTAANNAGAGPLNRNANTAPNSTRTSNASAANSGATSRPLGQRLSQVGNAISAGLSSRSAAIAMMVIVFAALIALIIYIVYKIRARNLKSSVIVDRPMKLYNMQETPKQFGRKKMAPTINGQEFTYSFWLYIVDSDFSSDMHRLIFFRNDEADLDKANPVVFMDGRTNRLYVSARTNKSFDVDNLNTLLPEHASANNYMTAVVEYIPLQRWVNIAVVFQDNLMTVYKDGDMYTVKNVHDLWDANSDADRPVFSGTKGNLYVGKTADNGTDTPGFLSRLAFHNYALMDSDVHALYEKGPVGGGLLGSVPYGVRSPIYRLDGSSSSAGHKEE